MRNDMVYVVYRQVVALQQLFAVVTHCSDGITEDETPLLIGVVHTVVNGIMR